MKAELLEKPTQRMDYDPLSLPTIEAFHKSPAAMRAIVGPVGSGKTSAATMEAFYYLPLYLRRRYDIRATRWVVVRNTYTELIDTTQKTVFEWLPFGHYDKGEKRYTIRFPKPHSSISVEVLFRSCDRPEDIKKFKSLELTGFWIDESNEVDQKIKLMLKSRAGRYPPKCPKRYGIETSNPPDIEDPMYHQYAWATPPPGPVSEKPPLADHVGFWQPPYENAHNLRDGYYEDLRNDYADNPDWIDMYIEGKPGVILRGRPVYQNFRRRYHVARESLIWDGQTIFRGWDNSGNCPACILVTVPAPMQAHILREFYSDKLGIVDFGHKVITSCNMAFPNAEYRDWGDPAGEQKYSKRAGGFTSNAQLMREELGIQIYPSENNLTTRISVVESMLGRLGGVLIDPSCTRLINGFLGGYCHPESRVVVGEFSDNILKNKYSHPHDALQYVFVRLFASQQARDKPKQQRRRRVKSYNPLWGE